MNLQLGFSFVAGILTTISPCVFPILPFLMASALRQSKKAPLYMILGLAISFIVVGFTLSRFGSLLGLGSDQIRIVSAFLLIVTSLFFLSQKLQDLVSEKMTSFSNLGTLASHKWKLEESSAADSLLLGGLLGVIWSPCAGPTLGVAVSLASQEGAALDSLLMMSVYAVGSVIPMLMIAYGFRSFFQKHQHKIMNFSQNSKPIFGAIILLTGISILFGFDKNIEVFLLNNLPEAWVNLITKY
ncbi:MAG: cytochrome c biogenesis CcdA family protein [Bdellovibrionaceae bacterium]|nr:cytochrome c biogenesis CcdA family protein [Pseudobdellovibrionaceae bacterium]